ncbi:RluA family pseudouridine synthase [Rickettsiales endosymbiont of Stachyamoeba lipophora]|uniref:RluA family pseudouridine synthase n=1 Tax=Rickettsiales endosymbiont of Stachyamoeba lipophora TaxID=2486578 RepID=UPI000F651CD6|nr:RluA family pseudouridine synthase [Rickettsiales endosymbiont of Stachyamoeba lipophora]AZL15454.1 RluA family pseudouridine synthase [Rickettsiales endosymbiont of Stachyamoeba lipophora]
MSKFEHNILKFCNLHFENKTRLDKIIFQVLNKDNQQFSRQKIQQIIKDGGIHINDGIISNASEKFQHISNLIIHLPKAKPSTLVPKNTQTFQVIFEDDDILIVNKPAGVTTHPGNGNFDDTLANELVGYLQSNLSGIGGSDRPGIVHRLDKDTSGLMVVAKNDQAHLNLSEQLKDRSLSRTYICLTYGLVSPKKGTIKTHIVRDSRDRTKMRAVASGGKEAITHYSVIEHMSNSQISIIECKLDTGRTHQIRTHFNHLGYPLIGDKLYNNNRKFWNNPYKELRETLKEFPRQALHSYKLGLLHPNTNQKMEFKIDIEQDIIDLINIIKQYE